MLMPNRTKYRKQQRKKGNFKRVAHHRANSIAFGEYGLIALDSKWISARQIEAARIAMTRHIKRGGKVWIRIFPHMPYTKKPAETRQGKGKGTPEAWVAPVRKGTVLFEMAGVKRELAQEAMRLAGSKLPIRTKFVARRDVE